MKSYTNELVDKMLTNGFDKEYISLCFQYSKRLTDNGLPVIFDMYHFEKLVGVKKSYIYSIINSKDEYYRETSIPKRKDGFRKLRIPVRNLKHIQRWILDNILYNIKVNESSKGFKPKVGIVDNAKPHVSQECLIKLDIKNFFDMIDYKRVFRIFYYYGYTKNMSYILADLCTYNNVLPQGAPTSPYISNIVCLRLDKRLNILCEKIGANYTRYADDITISGDKSIIEYFNTFIKIVSTEGFDVNEEKIKIIVGNKKKTVTGIVVNEKLSVDRKMKRFLRQHIYYCKKFGVRNHLEKIECKKSFYKEYLYGIAYFINSVEPEVGKSFLNELNEINWEY
ncbi:MAG: retron St85 family RNA-directed DNA polymerase [Clostridium sp.]